MKKKLHLPEHLTLISYFKWKYTSIQVSYAHQACIYLIKNPVKKATL